MNGRKAVEPATPDDARGIYDLLTEAFGTLYLRFTVYQSENSVGSLAEQIASTLDRQQPAFFVLRNAGEVEGFYSAVDSAGGFFLNYIATRTAVRGKGVGRLLYDHFEALGMSRGYSSLALDVFRSNLGAEAWYRRRGFSTRSSRFLARFALAGFDAVDGPRLELDQGALTRALEEEAARGFSSVECASSKVAVRLGFIAGTVCNLLEPLGVTALAVAPAVANRFRGSRRWLLATGPHAFAGRPSPESQEEALHMTKALITAEGAKR